LKKTYLSWELIANFFGFAHRAIINYHYRAYLQSQKIKLRGRPKILSSIQLRDLLRYVKSSQRTYDDYIQLIQKKLKINICWDMPRKFLKQNEFTMIRASPMEENRVRCPHESIEAYFVKVKRKIDNLSANFIFNFDLNADTHFIDARDIKIIVKIE
jgi:hypothetical protein